VAGCEECNNQFAWSKDGEECRRKMGRPKLIWLDDAENDLGELNVER
jgi:hypothetical protein